jgi:hypothetical protein
MTERGMTTGGKETQRAAHAMRRAVRVRAALCLTAIAAVSVGAGLIYLPAGLLAGGLLVYIDCQRTH